MSGSAAYSAFQFRMPVAFSGTVVRAEAATITPETVLSSNPPTVYGGAVFLDTATGFVRAPLATDTAADIFGLLCRPFPFQGGWADTIGTTQGIGVIGNASVMKRGYMQVQLYGGAAAAKGGNVYVQFQNGTAATPLGCLLAASGANTLVVPNAYFMGPADSLGGTEIAFNI
jgi:hypothetical protein